MASTISGVVGGLLTATGFDSAGLAGAAGAVVAAGWAAGAAGAVVAAGAAGFAASAGLAGALVAAGWALGPQAAVSRPRISIMATRRKCVCIRCVRITS